MPSLIAPENIDIFRVAQLRGQCRIMSAGMKIRGLRKSDLTVRVAQWTDNPPRRDYAAMIADCTAWLAIHNPAPLSPPIGVGDVRHQ
jgi:hypothetical protein